jgi:predicted lipoprotein with Yx(FWY)xxD motif
MTLYYFEKDKVGTTTCYAQCATNWPPYTVSADTQLMSTVGIDDDLSTIVRADGATQVAYKGMPLYFYLKDSKPGDVTGDGVGGAWHVAKP